ncbi:hypothetical protein RCL1_006122 [Eukaryota sp. TZLM3-RCL]
MTEEFDAHKPLDWKTLNEKLADFAHVAASVLSGVQYHDLTMKLGPDETKPNPQHTPRTPSQARSTPTSHTPHLPSPSTPQTQQRRPVSQPAPPPIEPFATTKLIIRNFIDSKDYAEAEKDLTALFQLEQDKKLELSSISGVPDSVVSLDFKRPPNTRNSVYYDANVEFKDIYSSSAVYRFFKSKKSSMSWELNVEFVKINPQQQQRPISQDDDDSIDLDAD